MWKYLLMVLVLQLMLAAVVYAMVRLAAQSDKADLPETDDALERAPTRQ